MFRKLSLALAITAALAPLSAQALGLGEIHTNSALNQNFKADIDLLSVDPEELDAVKVELAPREAYARAQVERSYLLTQLQFAPSVLPDGRTVIRVTSKNPIQEPFLNFLIEVNWPKGRLVREYTVLLDPPVTLQRRPEPVRAPVSAQAPRDEAMPAEVARTPASSPAVGGVSGTLEYGPTQSADTLWAIATSMRVAGASVEQVMIALLRYNPNAFIDNNINLLKTGQILRLPSRDAVMEIARREAREAFLEQTARWRGAARAEPSVSSETEPESVGDAVAGEPATESEEPAPEAVAQPSVAAEPEEPLPEAELKLVSADTEPSDEMALGEAIEEADAPQLQQELLLAREETAIARQAGEELGRRVEELEDQLADMQRLLSLQSNQLSRMQADAERQAAEAAASATAAQEPPPAGWLERLTSDGALMAAAGGGLLLLLGGGAALALRRRKEEEQMAGSSVLASAPGADAGPASADRESGGMDGLGAEEADAALFEPEMDSVDALTEAEVYAAYGRHDQAREMLLGAIARQPERVELKYKLLEVYAALGDAAAFVKMAEEMHASGADREDPAAWQTVLDQGRQLAPENALFAADRASETPDQTTVAGAAARGTEDSGSRLDFDLDVDLEELDPQTASSAEELAPASGSDDAATDRSGAARHEEGAEIRGRVAGVPPEEGPEPAQDDESLSLEEFAPIIDEPRDVQVEEPELEEFTLEGLGEETGTESGENEVETKLDLAEAYLDMGDSEDATGILQEVLAEGTEGQRKKAEQMLQRISG